ncbi:MAG: hypothetical protein J7K61_04890 [Thermoplasmata archaeon]|nr:hypothetical protein [Thermoplasmata archaeon]
MHEFKLIIEDSNAEIIYNALKIESAPNANVDISFDNGKLVLFIKAEKISNLRAAINSFIRWIEMIRKISGEKR